LDNNDTFMFVTATTLSAAFLNIFQNYLPKEKYSLAVISGVLIILVISVLIESVIGWRKIYLMNDQELSSVNIRLIGNLNYKKE